MVLLYSTAVFAEASEDDAKQDQCKYDYERTLTHPGSLTFSCLYRLNCEGLKVTTDDERSMLENDYLTQLFLHKNPNMSLDEALISGLSFDPASVWVIREKRQDMIIPYPSFAVTFNSCADITSYDYLPSEKEQDEFRIRHPQTSNATENLRVFGEDKYEIAARILDQHTSPKIQINEFNIQPNEIRCNDGLDLYKHNGNIPVCVKPQTYEKLLERGFDLEPV
ncbi:hypothetical protein [Nitrosopumilus ureiphilus]|uniref:Uncharacterized protein n=1 Tax=Nitrosopumilus ureiphilus TaxID=1470067 RepID=A0A7D5M791_9ARCH|nr:hypothetical protein [Nitrosopumilus ureiphilus]QLH06190.1 hypothetical protein C5F50_03170 [Nitrosopumilus ureiphilus]